ncbi:hypothetical protein IKG31_02520 [Candidatus Saccharibacteria bacterium]|nr:hypothetical protein [Candidatus Saccharibacteria bacterium]
MDNQEIYKKTIVFSIKRLLWDILSFVVLILVTAAGFFIAEKISDNGLIGLAIGFIVGIIAIAIVSHFISYVFKAGQIAMMTRAIADGKLPDDVYGEGKKIVKERFLTVAAYYAVTNAIKGIFNEIGNAISAIGSLVGGKGGGAIGGTISSVIQTIVAYLCDCCLGWVFYRQDRSAFKATLEGAVLFFKHGKTFAKNMGRVFGMAALSFIAIGGVFFGVFYLISSIFPGVFEGLAKEMAGKPATATATQDLISSAQNLKLMVAGVGAIIMWGMIHSTFVRPYVLIGVLRNYIESGNNEVISEEDLNLLDSKSRKFKKLHAKTNA